jgi:ABC-type oligopeptide transport system substrate-binding subunit
MSSNGRLAGFLLVLLAGCGKGNESTAWPSATSDPKILEARRLLTDAGFEFGRGFPKLTFLYNTSESHKKIAAAFQEMWRSKLGIEIELRNLEWKVFLDHLNRGDYDIGRRGYYGEYLDPHALLSLFTANSHFNTTGWTSAEFDGLLSASDEERDPARRYELLGKAERLLFDAAPIFTSHHYQAHNLIKPFVKGVYLNHRDLHPLQGITVEGPGRPDDGVLILHGGAEPSSLDPGIAQDLAGLKLIMHLFEGLVIYHPVDARPIPGVAERWEISPDGRTYTFHLRPAQWSNGDPVKAGDFVYSWRRAVDPKTASPYSYRMYEVSGAREIASGSAAPSTLGVRALDDRTLEVRLVHRAPYFLEMLCLHIFMPVHPATVEKHGKDWTRVEHLVGNGPYRLVEWKLKDRKVFVKNPAWRDAGSVKLDKFIVLASEDIEAAFRMYEGGQCHWLYTVPLAFVEEVAKRPDSHRNPINGTLFYTFNLKRKPLDDVRVRRALSLAVDREQVTRYILRGGEIPAERLTPPLYPGYGVK